MTLLTCGSSSLTISHELPITSSATRSVGNKLSASVLIPSGVDGSRPADEHLALLADSDLDEVKVHIQPDAPAQRP